jgi:hypothetical protein
MKKYFIILMTLKLIDLFETKFIGEQKEDAVKEFKKIETHSILDIDERIRSQFMLLVSTYHNNIYIVNIFKKLFDKNNEWNDNKIQYINTICLSCTVENKYNWRDLEDKDFLNNKKLDESYFILDESYNRSILSDDYDFFIDLKTRYINITNNFEDELCKKLWGRTYHKDSIVWQVLITNFVMMLYGSGINEIYFRSKNFKKVKLKELYYPHYDNNSIIYTKFTDNRLGICNNCEDNINLERGNIWHEPDYGDLCEYCFKDKVRKEKYRFDYIKRLIKSLGSRELFKRKLKNTRKYLEENGIKELSDGEKYKLMKKFNENMLNVKEKKFMECCVCLEEMTEDIYAGNCGHCLHELCYFKLNSNKCPLCRKISNFKKLHL